MPAECRQYWGCIRTARRTKINPAYHPNCDDGSDRYIVVEFDIQDAAVIADKDARTRRLPALTYLSEKTELMGILKAD
eukprot:5310764-Pyramimonas_sp.AAC.1